jgi:exodeoxyribonuclease VII small subunit
MVEQDSYLKVSERLEEIVAQVRSKDVPLEKSLDLYEEALRLGGRAAELIDRTDFSPEELQAVLEKAPEMADAEAEETSTEETSTEGIEAEEKSDKG